MGTFNFERHQWAEDVFPIVLPLELRLCVRRQSAHVLAPAPADDLLTDGGGVDLAAHVVVNVGHVERFVVLLLVGKARRVECVDRVAAVQERDQ